jgi:hypothetical protein
LSPQRGERGLLLAGNQLVPSFGKSTRPAVWWAARAMGLEGRKTIRRSFARGWIPAEITLRLQRRIEIGFREPLGRGCML